MCGVHHSSGAILRRVLTLGKDCNVQLCSAVVSFGVQYLDALRVLRAASSCSDSIELGTAFPTHFNACICSRGIP
jgi:hypothetical protein